MKLLVKKTNVRGNSKKKDGIRISKTSFSILGTAFDRLIDVETGISANVGINEEGNICLYTSKQEHPSLYRMYFPKKYPRTARASLNTKIVGDSLTPYIGTYDIKYVSISGQDKGVTEVVLKKLY